MSAEVAWWRILQAFALGCTTGIQDECESAQASQVDVGIQVMPTTVTVSTQSNLPSISPSSSVSHKLILHHQPYPFPIHYLFWFWFWSPDTHYYWLSTFWLGKWYFITFNSTFNNFKTASQFIKSPFFIQRPLLISSPSSLLFLMFPNPFVLIYPIVLN